MRILFYIFLFLILIFLFTLLAASGLYAILKSLFAHAGKAMGNRNRDKDKVVIDVTPEVVARNHSIEEKNNFAAKALIISLSNSKNKEPVFHHELEKLDGYIKHADPSVKHELTKSRHNLGNLNRIINDNRQHFNYTSEVLGSTANGIHTMFNSDANIDGDYSAGLLYATERLDYYIGILSHILSAAERTNNDELITEIKSFVEVAERLNWLFLVYPKCKAKHEEFVDDMILTVLDKLQVYNNTVRYGVKSAESEDFFKQTFSAIKDITKAFNNILESIVNNDLLHANVELEVIRKNIKLKGLT